jgi:phosphatidate cytidylyltransferase
MKRVLTAVVLIPVVLAILFKAPNWFYSGFIGLIAVLAVHEYFGIAIRYQQKLYVYMIEVAIGLYFLGQCLRGFDAFGSDSFGYRFGAFTSLLTGPRVLPLLLLGVSLSLKDLRQSLPATAFSYFGFLYVAFPLGAISQVGQHEFGRFIVFIFLVVVWSGDIFAYYIGRAFGKHKLAEHISPKKTWEGAIASLAGATIVSVLLFRYAQQISSALFKAASFVSHGVLYADAPNVSPTWLVALLFGLLVNIAAQLGDLAESAMKRGAGVKDSGNLLPGHGGMLDRIDALLFAAPVLWFFDPLLYKSIHIIQ